MRSLLQQQLFLVFVAPFFLAAGVSGFCSPGLPSTSTFSATSSRASNRLSRRKYNVDYTQPSWELQGMKRPLLDQLASALFRLENARVEASSEVDEKGRNGEPMEWSESSSFANQFSEAIASNSLGYKFKQFVADIVAGEYDEASINAKIDSFIQDESAPVAMFSFTTCPFCRRAKDYLDERCISYNVMELDERDDNEGNEIRAALGKRIKRTSVPSIFIGGKSIGGFNDGPGLLPLGESGELDKLLQSV